MEWVLLVLIGAAGVLWVFFTVLVWAVEALEADADAGSARGEVERARREQLWDEPEPPVTGGAGTHRA